MNKYKFFSLIILVFIFINFSTVLAHADQNPPALTSEGVVLINADTGQVVYSKNPDTKYFPASTTKILTALIVIEKCKLDDKVTIGKIPASADGTAIGLKEGEVFTVKELLLGLLLESGNDCAEALAEHISGSCSEFAKLMNQKAKELGANNSNFTNPSGLPDENHYTTPKDLALIMNACIKNPTFIEIDKTKTLQMQKSNVDGSERWLNNHNYILFPDSQYYYKYAVASKKGYTIAAKFTDVISCTKDGTTYVGAFLRGENINTVFSDIDTVFDYVFNNYQNTKLYSEGDEVGKMQIDSKTSIPLLATTDVYYCTKTSDASKITKEVKYDTLEGLDKKSFNRGDTLTSGKVYVNGTYLKDLSLASGEDHLLKTKIATTTGIGFYDNHKALMNILIGFFAVIGIRVVHVKIKKMKRQKKLEALKKISKPKKKSKIV